MNQYHDDIVHKLNKLNNNNNFEGVAIPIVANPKQKCFFELRSQKFNNVKHLNLESQSVNSWRLVEFLSCCYLLLPCQDR